MSDPNLKYPLIALALVTLMLSPALFWLQPENPVLEIDSDFTTPPQPAGFQLAGTRLAGTANPDQPLNVVVTIAPLHSLVTAIMAGIAEPYLLLAGATSPHNWALKPSDSNRLKQADLIFRIAPEFENFLDRPVRALGKQAHLVDLIDTEGLTLLPMRKPDLSHPPDPGPDPDHGQAGTIDPHIWLDPQNALILAAAINKKLASHDPANASRYQKNFRALARQLTALDQELAQILAATKNHRFIVLHDFLQYFEHRYQLNLAAIIAANPHQLPGAAHLGSIKALITRENIPCLLREPQFAAPIINRLAENTAAVIVPIDPIGVDLPPGAALYQQLMRQNARNLVSCLSSQNAD